MRGPRVRADGRRPLLLRWKCPVRRTPTGTEGTRDLIRVTIRNGESPEKLLQRFKRTVAKEGLLKEIKKRNYYEKPSEARRRRAREQEKLLRKKARKKALKDMRRKRRR